MDLQRWLDEVRNELHTRRLPRRDVTRLLRELSDHVTDGLENTMNTDVRVFPAPHHHLGSPRQVADTAEKEFQSRRFAARFPWMTFGLLPLLTFPFVAAATFAAPGWFIVTILDSLELAEPFAVAEDSDLSTWLPGITKSYAAGTIILAAALVVWVTARLARRAAVSARWPLASAVLVALLAGSIWSDATPKTRDKQGMLMVGIGYPLRAWTLFQSVQLVAPLALGVWLTRQRPTTPTTPLDVARAA